MLASKDRIALVTGANKGIGFEIARQLGKEGNRILIGARDRDRGQTAVANLRSEGFAARYVQIDLTELATIAAAAADIESQEGRLDILINNAGITSSGDGRPVRPVSKPSDVPSTPIFSGHWPLPRRCCRY